MSVEQATDKNRADLARAHASARRLSTGRLPPALSWCGRPAAGAGSGLSISRPTKRKPASPRSRSTARPATAGQCAELDAFFGRPGEGENFFTALAGRQGELSWRYLLLAPVTFEQSLVVKANDGDKVEQRRWRRSIAAK